MSREFVRTGRAFASASSYRESFAPHRSQRRSTPLSLPRLGVKILQPANDRFCQFAAEGGRLPAKAHQRSEVGTNGLPLFSRSSSKLSDGKMVAHPAGRLFSLANDSAEF